MQGINKKESKVTKIRQMYQFIPFGDNTDQRKLQCDWMRGTRGHKQPKVTLVDATFPWWISSSKKSEILTGSFQCHCW